MSQSKKNWIAGKAKKTAVNTVKRNIKEKLAEAKDAKRRIAKGKA